MDIKGIEYRKRKELRVRMPCKADKVKLTEEIRNALERIVKRPTSQKRYVDRGTIVLCAADGLSYAATARRLSMDPVICGKWVKRFIDKLPEIEESAESENKELEDAILDALRDSHRSGRPTKFNASERIVIGLVACHKPRVHGVEATHWTGDLLKETVIREGIVQDISTSTIRRILRRAEIKPWTSRYWLSSADKVRDLEAYRQKIRRITAYYRAAGRLEKKNHHVVSGDEMTGIQATERKYADMPCVPGLPRLTEFEYIRHGTVSMIGFLNVATGVLYPPFLKETRTAQDFVVSVAKVTATDPDGKWTFILDGLNIHKSAELVHFIADQCGITIDLGKKGRCGILKDMKSRMEFLSDPSHRIHFVYTPCHSSWVNQIEIYFSGLSRRLLRFRDYSSKKALCQSIRRYVDQKNAAAKPYSWRYTGRKRKCDAS